MQSMDISCPINTVHDNFISNLESTFSESLQIQDAQKSEHASEGDDKRIVSERNLCGFKQRETKLNIKCLKKAATFPLPDMMLPSSSYYEEADTSRESPLEESAHQTYSRSVSLPVPLKLVSAMKGSREKHGGSQMKLTVKWASDVYDPVPTLLSHTVKRKKQQKPRKKKCDKKNGKKGQKDNSSRGGSGKDKQQFRKMGGSCDLCYKLMHSRDDSGKDKQQFRKMGDSSDLCYKSTDSRDEVIEASPELDALDGGSQDSNCGTSFLKTSVTKVHYSVAEAL